MEGLKDLLQKRVDLIATPKVTRVNMVWHEAEEFGSRVGLDTKFVLRIFKMFGKKKVLGLQSWLTDLRTDSRGKQGLIIWKLKKICQSTPTK